MNLYAYTYNDAANSIDPSGEAGKGKAAAYIVKLTGDSMRAVARVSKEQAVRLRRAGVNILARSRQTAHQIEVAAHSKEKLIRHAAEQEGYRPHYQTSGKFGHTFWSVVGTVALAVADAVEGTADAADTAGKSIAGASETVGQVVDALDPLETMEHSSNGALAPARLHNPIRKQGSESDGDKDAEPDRDKEDKVVCTGSRHPSDSCGQL